MDEDQEISRGENAKRLLENPLLNEALGSMERHYEEAWKGTGLSQVNVREEAYKMLCTVQEFKNHLTTFINTGKLASVAKAQRQDEEERGRRLTEWDGSPDGQPRS